MRAFERRGVVQRRRRARGDRFRMRVHSAYAGWDMEELKTVWVTGRRITDEEFPLIGNETVPRTLFMVGGDPIFTMPVPVPIIEEQGIKARWIYRWEEADIAGVAFMMGGEESLLITPVPISALKEVRDDRE